MKALPQIRTLLRGPAGVLFAVTVAVAGTGLCSAALPSAPASASPPCDNSSTAPTEPFEASGFTLCDPNQPTGAPTYYLGFYDIGGRLAVCNGYGFDYMNPAYEYTYLEDLSVGPGLSEAQSHQMAYLAAKAMTQPLGSSDVLGAQYAAAIDIIQGEAAFMASYTGYMVAQLDAIDPAIVAGINSLVAEAQQLAGPYTTSVALVGPQAPAGGAGVASVSVAAASGALVPNASVSLSSTGGVALTASSAVTDGSGVVHVGYTVPAAGVSGATIDATGVSLTNSQLTIAVPGQGRDCTDDYIACAQRGTGTPLSPTQSATPGSVAINAAPPIPASPTLGTTVTAAKAAAGAPVADTVHVSGWVDGTAPYVLDVTLLGPVPAPAEGCATLTAADYANAGTIGATTVTITGNGDFVTPSIATAQLPAGSAPMCATFSESGRGPIFTGGDVLSTPPAAPNESVLLIPLPLLGTTISSADAIGGQAVSDTVHVSGWDAELFGDFYPLTVSLLGPVPAPAEGCATLTAADYANAGTIGTTTVTITGNGDFVTPAIATATPSAADGPQCSTFAETGTAPLYEGGPTLSTPPAAPNESVRTVPLPVISTDISSGTAMPGDSVTDTIHVANWPTAQDGTPLLGPVAITVTLVGDVALPGSGSCNDADWSTAVQLGLVTGFLDGDGDYLTDPVPLSAKTDVCGSWIYTTGELWAGGPTLAAVPGDVREVVTVGHPAPAAAAAAASAALAVTGAGGNNYETAAVGSVLVLAGAGALLLTRRRRDGSAES